MTVSIQLNLEIKGYDGLPYSEMEKLRVEMRRHMLSFIFARADNVKIDHRNLSVDGDIKIKETL